MHRSHFQWSLTLLAFCSFSSICLADLQVHLPFDENVGSTAFNKGATGAENNAPLGSGNARVAGQIGGGAISFNNTSTSSIVAGLNPTPEDTLRTISFWVNTTEAGGQNEYLSFGTNNNPAGGTSDPGTKFDIGIDAGTGHLEVGVGGGRLNSGAATITTPALNDGTWRLATVVIPDILDDDPSAADMSDIDIYVDGVFSYDGSSNTSADRTISTAANGSFFLGRAANGAGSGNSNGSIDDVAVWDNPLTPDEIKGLFDVGQQLGTNAGIYDQVLSLHNSGSGTIHAGDYTWTYASGLSSSAGISGNNLVLDDAANTGVTFTGLVPGDVNRNSIANLDDFSIILANFLDPANSRDDGDLNGDGIVDFSDFRVWSDATGNTASFASLSAAVPEPSSVLLLVAGFAAALALQRRRVVVMAVAGLALAVCSAPEVSAQTLDVYFTPANGDYDSDANWDSGFRPEGGLDERANIGANNADAILVGAASDATATLDTTGLSPSGLLLGNGLGSVGRLNIGTSGSLSVPGTVTDTTGIRLGTGNNGRGMVTIVGNGSLSGLSLNVNGQTDGFEESDWSAVRLAGNASLTTTTANMQFNRVIEVTGSNVTIDSATDIGFGARGRYYANITGSTHSIMRAAGNLQLDGGVLVPNFSGSANPVEGASWDLFDTATTAGQFDEVRVPGRVPGQGFVLETRPGGNGVITSLAIRSTLVLEVDRDTGEVQITQPFGSPVFIDGYSIESASGHLGPGTWTSLDSQNISDWTESNATEIALNELKPTSSTTISGAGFNIGQAYTPDFSVFGQRIDEDLVFEYSDITTGQIVQGEVIYSGTKVNDLVLIVDPATGEAQLRNTSNASLSLDGYKISSESGSITSAGWMSLESQASADWFEAAESSTTLAELLPEGDEILGANQGYNLGALFSTTGEQDFVVEYLQDGANVLQAGQVLYDVLPDLPDPVVGDYNGNGVVDAADYTIWRDSLGSTGPGLPADGDGNNIVDASDYNIWVANFGNSSSASLATSASSVPEASSGVIAMLAMFIGGIFGRKRVAFVPAYVPLLKVKPFKTIRNLTALIAAFALVAFGASSSAQTILFDHNFSNAPTPGTAVTSVADLGTPAVGSFSFSASPVGGIGGGANPALAVAHSGNVANLTDMVENSVTYSGTFPETMVADAGTGDLVYVDFDSTGPITSGTTKTDISFSMNLFGTNNSGSFKYNFIRGLDASDNEVFELLQIGGSGGGTRQWYARGAADDETTLTAANAGTPEGQLLANGFNALVSTNVANGRPADAVSVGISLSSSMVTFDITATDGSGTPTAVNGMALPINSGATSISRLEFSSIWNSTVNGQNKGYWVDDLFATTNPIGTFPLGDVNFDGNVDLLDFDIISGNFKETASSISQGDVNEDGFVDFADFKIWKEASATGSLANSLIPEPTSIVLALVALAGLAGRCRR